MNEAAKCWIDGAIVSANEAKVSVFDHGFLYGDGVFEGIRFYNNKVFRLPLHIKRLWRSARALNIAIPMSEQAVIEAIQATVDAFEGDEGYLRVLVTRGVGALGIDPATCAKPSVIIIANELKMVSDEERAEGVKTIIASTRRLSPDQMDSRIKSMNYLNAILARMEANHAGAEEAILLNKNGYVAEGTADNLFIVRDGELLTPPITDGALAGITRQTVMEVAESLGIKVTETSLTPYDLYTADECFLTGTGAKLIPVRDIDGRSLPQSREMYQRLSQGFTDFIKQETT